MPRGLTAAIGWMSAGTVLHGPTPRPAPAVPAVHGSEPIWPFAGVGGWVELLHGRCGHTFSIFALARNGPDAQRRLRLLLWFGGRAAWPPLPPLSARLG